MKLLAILTPEPTTDLPSMGALRVAEECVLWQLYVGGIVREMYFDDAPLRVTFVMEADSLEAAQNHLAALPMVQAKLPRVETFPLKPWTPLENLFIPEGRED